jgi:hypothetical protein
LDFYQVYTFNSIDIPEYYEKQLLNLLQCHYISNESITHNITSDELFSKFKGFSNSCYISVYHPKKIQLIESSQDEKNIQLNFSNNISGCITSKPIYFVFRPTLNDTYYEQMIIYFIDYLCIQREDDYKTISRKLLQTHEHNQRIYNPNIHVSIIKKEVELFDGVIPLVSYDTYTYTIPKIKPFNSSLKYYIEKINEENINLISDFFQNSLDNKTHNIYFDIIIFIELNNLLLLIKNNIYHIYCLKHKNNVFAIYFFKNMKNNYDNIEGNSIQLVSSIMKCKSPEVFYKGFINALSDLKKTYKDFKILLIDNIGHNTTILYNWSQYNKQTLCHQSAYYLLNYIYPNSPMFKERCFILF